MQDNKESAVRGDGDGVVISVKVVPGASRDKVAGALGDCVKIVTSAPPEKGKANKAVGAILAKALGVGRKDVQLISGQTNARKEFRAAPITVVQARRALGLT